MKAPWNERNLPTGPELFIVIEANFLAELYEEPDIEAKTVAYLGDYSFFHAYPVIGYLGRFVKNTKNVTFWWFYVVTPFGVGWINSYNCTRLGVQLYMRCVKCTLRG